MRELGRQNPHIYIKRFGDGDTAYFVKQEGFNGTYCGSTADKAFKDFEVRSPREHEDSGK